MVLSTENNKYWNCYNNHYNLSEDIVAQRYQSTQFKSYFDGKILVNWAMFSAPRHPLLLETMRYIVDLVKREYLKESVIELNAKDSKFKPIFCITGPMLLTAVARNMISAHSATHGSSASFPIRVVNTDFRDYGNFLCIFSPLKTVI